MEHLRRVREMSRTIHIERKGPTTYCGRRVPKQNRLVCRNDPMTYLRVVEMIGRRGCYSCSDRRWDELRRGGAR